MCGLRVGRKYMLTVNIISIRHKVYYVLTNYYQCRINSIVILVIKPNYYKIDEKI